MEGKKKGKKEGERERERGKKGTKPNLQIRGRYKDTQRCTLHTMIKIPFPSSISFFNTTCSYSMTNEPCAAILLANLNTGPVTFPPQPQQQPPPPSTVGLGRLKTRLRLSNSYRTHLINFTPNNHSRKSSLRIPGDNGSDEEDRHGACRGWDGVGCLRDFHWGGLPWEGVRHYILALHWDQI